MKTLQQQQSQSFSLFIIGSLFFIFGFITWLNSQLIPFLKQVCDLKTDTQAYLVTFAFYISYFFMSIPSSYILKRTGFTNGMVLGLLVMALGSLLFIPAALGQRYILFLTALFIQGSGLALLQTASNPYVVVLGSPESAARRICLMGICNKTAGMIGIFIFGTILFSNMEAISSNLIHLTGEAYEAELQMLSSRLIFPYIVIAVVLSLLALMLLRSNLPKIEPEEKEENKVEKSVFSSSYLYLWFGVIAIFAYVGAEVITIDTLTLYGNFHGYESVVAKNFSVYSLIALTVGYLVGIVLMPRFISQRTALTISCVLALILVCLAIIVPSLLSIGLIIALSFAHAVMWPCIWPLSLKGLGKHTKAGSAFLIMAIAGGALLPLLYGLLSEISNRQRAYLILIPLYIYILFFSIYGSKTGKNNI
ncbi:MAG: glucose/galactose MFS transporter [Bacteroidales bacterium]|jgi:glucose/galactose transporter|nr:glucose/galactose MFS transporter [Bacteroidales bacterium]